MNKKELKKIEEARFNSSFVGRNEELKLFADLLDSDGSFLLWVQGSGGVGKTWLLNHMRQQVWDRTGIKSAFIDFYPTEHSYISGFCRAIIYELGKEAFGSFVEINHELEQLQQVGVSFELISLQQERRDRAFIESYNQVEEKTRLLLLFDTFELVQARDSELFHWILNQFLPNIKNTLVVIASRSFLETIADIKNINSSLISLKGFSSDEMQFYLETRSSSALDGISPDPDLLRKVLDLTGGNPLLLSLAADYLRTNSLAIDLEEIDSNEFTMKLVQNIAGFESPLNQIVLLLSQANQRINADLLKYLISSDVLDLDEDEIESLLNELSHFSFIKYGPEGEIVLHDEMQELIRSYVWPSIDPDRNIRRLWNDTISTYYHDVVSRSVTHPLSTEEYEYKRIKALLTEQLLNQGYVDRRFVERKNYSTGNSFQRFVQENTEFDVVYDGEQEILTLSRKSFIQELSKQWKKLASRSISKPRFEKISTQLLQNIVEVLEIDLIFETSQLGNDDSLVFYLKLNSVFKETGLPSRLPIIIHRCNAFGEEELNFLYDAYFSNRLGSRVAVLITFIPNNALEDAQRLLEHKIRQVFAYDIILIGHEDLRLLIASRNPSHFLRSLLLSRIDLTTVSPFVTTGYASNDIFFGREHELREISEHIHTLNYALVGGRRIGKTSILKRLQGVRLPVVGYHALYHDCSISPTQEEFVQAILADRSWFPKPPAFTPSTIIGIFKELPHDKPLVILLDETDKLIAPDRSANYPLLKAFRALSNTGRCHFVLSGERALRLELTNPDSPLYNFSNEIVVGRLDYHALEELVTRPMRQLEIELVDEKTIIQSIWDFTSGHPNVAQRLCQKLIVLLNRRRNRRLTIKDIHETVTDPNFLRKDFLNVYWERATVLERLCSLTMAADENARTLMAIQTNLTNFGIEVTLNQIDNALERLTDLRTILRRTSDGYAFAVTAFPMVVAKTARLNDLISLYRETYQQYGDIEPRSKRGVS